MQRSRTCTVPTLLEGGEASSSRFVHKLSRCCLVDKLVSAATYRNQLLDEQDVWSDSPPVNPVQARVGLVDQHGSAGTTRASQEECRRRSALHSPLRFRFGLDYSVLVLHRVDKVATRQLLMHFRLRGLMSWWSTYLDAECWSGWPKPTKPKELKSQRSRHCIGFAHNNKTYGRVRKNSISKRHANGLGLMERRTEHLR